MEILVGHRYTLLQSEGQPLDRSWTRDVFEVIAVNGAHAELQEIKTDGSNGMWRTVVALHEFEWFPADDFCR